MATLGHRVEIAGAEAKLRAVGRQAPFVMAMALTNIARDAKAAVERRIGQAFDRPTPFTQNAVAIVPATKTKLMAQVLVKDIQARYLGIQETGGVRTPQPGMPVILPVNIAINPFGNVPRGRIGKERDKGDTFVSKQDTPATRHLPPGIYRRFRKPKRKAGRPPRLLVAFKKRASYRPLFHFVDTVFEAVARSKFERLSEAVARALRSIR